MPTWDDDNDEVKRKREQIKRDDEMIERHRGDPRGFERELTGGRQRRHGGLCLIWTAAFVSAGGGILWAVVEAVQAIL